MYALNKLNNFISITKLYTILLIKDNFNIDNNLIINKIVIPSLENKNKMPQTLIRGMYL